MYEYYKEQLVMETDNVFFLTATTNLIPIIYWLVGYIIFCGIFSLISKTLLLLNSYFKNFFFLVFKYLEYIGFIYQIIYLCVCLLFVYIDVGHFGRKLITHSIWMSISIRATTSHIILWKFRVGFFFFFWKWFCVKTIET